jgi:signal transduction histidine kinase
MDYSILIAEDNRSLRRSMADYLLEKGYFVSEVDNGSEALLLFREIRPNVVVTDLSMPMMNGLELIKAIKGESADTPCLLISGEGTMADVIEGLRLGAWDYLVKPISPLDLLVHAIERALERARLIAENRRYQHFLEHGISERTAELEQKNLLLEAEIESRHKLEFQLLQAKKLEAVGQLAAGIAHEINTPIQFVSSNLGFLDDAFTAFDALMSTLQLKTAEHPLSTAAFEEILEENDWSYLAKELPEAIHQSREGLNRVSSIVRAMKEFSHPGGREFAPVDINNIINVTVTVARNEWKYGSEVRLNLDRALPAIPGLANEIGQALLNLLVNAAHAITDKLGKTPEGGKGRITIATSHDDQWVNISIADTGCGIPEAILDRIFDPFFTTKEVGKGTGQGLAIAYDVVTHKHGGNLSVQSRLGEGTTFTIKLPKVRKNGL